MKSKILLLLTLISLTDSALAQMKADIVGLRLAMDVKETVEAIKTHIPNARVAV